MDRQKVALYSTAVAGAVAVSLGAWMALAGNSEVVELAGNEAAPLPQLDASDNTPDVVPSAQPPESPPPIENSTCSNPRVGYTIVIPAGYEDQAPSGKKACRLIDDDPVVAEEAEIRLTRLNVGYDDWVASYEGDQIDVIDRFDTTVGGHTAVAIHFRFTDSPEIEVYDYLIESDGKALILEAYSDYSEDFAASRSLVDEIASTMEFAS